MLAFNWRGDCLKTNMECFQGALIHFLVELCENRVKMPEGKNFVRLCRNGTWEVTKRKTLQFGPAYHDADGIYPHGICLPLSRPLTGENLLAALEKHRWDLEEMDEEENSYDNGPLIFPEDEDL